VGHPYRKESLSNLQKALRTQAEKYEKSTAPGDAEKAKARQEELRLAKDE